jgi:hypothetical protein
MADVEPTPRKQSLKMAGVIAATVLGANALFSLMAGLYYKGHSAQALIDIGSIRIAFGVLSLSIAGMAYVAAFAPRLIGHAIGFAAGTAALAGGFASLGTSFPGIVAAALLVTGVVLPVLTWRSMRHSRPAWAFLVAVLAVLATVTFFGAPKMRNVLGIGLWYAMIIPAVYVIGVIALSMVRSEYREQQS